MTIEDALGRFRDQLLDRQYTAGFEASQQTRRTIKPDNLIICGDCGCLVADWDIHDRFHLTVVTTPSQRTEVMPNPHRT